MSKVVFLLLSCVATWSQLGQSQDTAPGDANPDCTIDVNFNDPGVILRDAYSETQHPLLDSYWYSRIFGFTPTGNPVWKSIQGLTNSQGWRTGQAGSCRSTMRAVCTSGASEDNWVATQFISRDTSAPSYNLTISVNVTVAFDNCACPKMFQIYYNARPGVDTSSQLRTSDYRLLATVNQTGMFTFNLQPGEGGFYLGFRDRDSCGSLNRLMVYREVCPTLMLGLSVYPETPVNSVPVPVTPQCSPNAELQGGSLQCGPDGSWVGSTRCVCSAGYMNTSSTVCSACTAGTFKSAAGNVACSPCPARTVVSSTGATVCACQDGYFRAESDDPGVACTVPPSSPPVSLRTGAITGSSVVLMWEPPAEPGDRDDLSYTISYKSGRTSYIINTPDREFTLINLEPLTEHNVTVRSDNGVSSQDTAGAGNRTTTIRVVTLAAGAGQPAACSSASPVLRASFNAIPSPVEFNAAGYIAFTFIFAVVIVVLVVVVVLLSVYIWKLKTETETETK